MPWGYLAGAAISALASDSAASKQAGAADRATALTDAQYKQTRSDLMPWQNTGALSLDQLKFMLGLGENPALGARPTAPDMGKFYKTRTVQNVPRNPYVNSALNMANRTGTEKYLDQDAYDKALNQYNLDVAQWDQAAANMQDGQGSQGGFGSMLKPFGMEDFQASPAYQFNLSEGMDAINKGAAARGNYYAPQTLQDLSKFAQGTASNEFQNAYNNYNTNMENIWRRLYGMSETGRGAATMSGQMGANAAGAAAANTIGAGNAQAAGIVGGANAINQGIGDAYNNYLMQQIISNQRPTFSNNGQGPAWNGLMG